MVLFTLENDMQLIRITQPYLKNFVTILLLLLPFTNPLSFNYNSFKRNERDINYVKSANWTNNGIRLTGSSILGRATYAEPMHLWDKASGNISDFATNFTFVVNSGNKPLYGDGFAFFLASAGSTIPDDAGGGSLGLAPAAERMTSTKPFVAVEFNIYKNSWDAEYNSAEHVGIDINSMQSVASVPWSVGNSILNGTTHQAQISYVSKSRTLTVVFTGFKNGIRFTDNLSNVTDLTEHLPEFVTFGFSAATGIYESQFTINTLRKA